MGEADVAQSYGQLLPYGFAYKRVEKKASHDLSDVDFASVISEQLRFEIHLPKLWMVVLCGLLFNLKAILLSMELEQFMHVTRADRTK